MIYDSIDPMIKRVILTVLCLLTMSGLVWGQELETFAHRLDSVIQIGLDSAAYPGAQLYISYRDSVMIHKAYGHHQYDGRIPVTTNDLYDVASITKVSATLPLLMQLYSQGKFDPDAPLVRYLPELSNTNKASITYREIMAHQGRLTPFIVFWRQPQKKNGNWRRRSFRTKPNKNHTVYITEQLYLHKNYHWQMYQSIAHTELRPTSEYVYSDLPFILTPLVLENITGIKLPALLNDRILDPLGIKRLSFNPREKYSLREIVPTEMDTFFRKQLVHGHVHDEAAAMLGGISGHAGLFGNAESVGKLFEMYTNYGFANGIQIVDSASVKEFIRYQYLEQGNRRGLGFDKPMLEYDPELSYISRDASSESFGHGGFTGTFVWADPEHRLVVVLLTNRVHPTRANRKLYTLDIRPIIHQLAYDYLTK